MYLCNVIKVEVDCRHVDTNVKVHINDTKNPCIPSSTLGCRDSSFLRLLRIVPSVATKEQVKSKRQKAPKDIDL